MSSEFKFIKDDRGNSTLVSADFGPTPPDPIVVPGMNDQSPVVKIDSGVFFNVVSKEAVLPESVIILYTDSFSPMTTVLIKINAGSEFRLRINQSKQLLGNLPGLLGVEGTGPNIFKQGVTNTSYNGYTYLSGNVKKNGIYNVVVTDVNDISINLLITVFTPPSPPSPTPPPLPTPTPMDIISSDIVDNPFAFPKIAIIGIMLMILLVVYVLITSD